MATMPTPEESGKEILAIFQEYDVRPGKGLKLQHIESKWDSKHDNKEDLIAGLLWLDSKGFIEQKMPERHFVYLTAAGYEAT